MATYRNDERNGDAYLTITGTGDHHKALVSQEYQRPDSELAGLQQENEDKNRTGWLAEEGFIPNGTLLLPHGRMDWRAELKQCHVPRSVR